MKKISKKLGATAKKVNSNKGPKASAASLRKNNLSSSTKANEKKSIKALNLVKGWSDAGVKYSLSGEKAREFLMDTKSKDKASRMTWSKPSKKKLEVKMTDPFTLMEQMKKANLAERAKKEGEKAFQKRRGDIMPAKPKQRRPSSPNIGGLQEVKKAKKFIKK